MLQNPRHKTETLPNISGHHFQGYFGDIRDLARRTLPRKPPQEFLSYFGDSVASTSCSELTLSPVNLFQDHPAKYPRRILGDARHSEDGFENISHDGSAFQYFPLSVRAALHNLDVEHIDKIPKRKCTKTKLLFGMSVYLGVVVLVLIIIVAILASSMKSTESPSAASGTNPGVSSSAIPPNQQSTADTTSNTTLSFMHNTTTGFTTQSSATGITIGTTSNNNTTVDLTTSNTTSTSGLETTSTTITATPLTTSTPSTTNLSTTTEVSTVAQPTTTKATTTQSSTTNTVTLTTTTPIATTKGTNTTTQISQPLSTAAPVMCQTDLCVSLGNGMSSMMDEDVDGCADFYNFACGQWIRTQESLISEGQVDPSDTTYRGNYDRISLYPKLKTMLESPDGADDSVFIEAAKQLYQSCLSASTDTYEQGMSELYTILDPLGLDQFLQSSHSLEVLQEKAMASFGVGALFQTSLQHATINGTKIYTMQVLQNYIEQVAQTLTLYFKYASHSNDNLDGSQRRKRSSDDMSEEFVEDRFDQHSDDEFDQKSYTSRRLLQENGTITSTWSSSNWNQGTADTVYTRVKDMLTIVVDVERKLAAVIEDGSPSGPAQLLSLQTLSSQMPTIQWSTATGLNSSSMVLVKQYGYFQILDGIVRDTNQNVIQLLIFTRIVLSGVWRYLPLTVRTSLDGLGGHTYDDYTWEDCNKINIHLLSSEMYLSYSEHFAIQVNESQIYLQSLVKNLTSSVSDAISKSSVMSNYTKRKATDILGNIPTTFSSAQEVDDVTILHSNVRANMSLLQLGYGYTRRRYRRDVLDLLGKPWYNQEPDWYTNSPNYDVESGTLVLPLAVTAREPELSPVFFTSSTVGRQIGVELLRSVFSDINDLQTSLPWWDDVSIGNFDEIMKCFSENVTDIGSVAKNEIASLVAITHAAVNISLTEYLTQPFSDNVRVPTMDYNAQQLYYISFAQDFCEIQSTNSGQVAKKMVNDVIRNTEGFVELFQCVDNSAKDTTNTCFLLE